MLLELGDAGGFFKDHAAFLRTALDDLRDLALGHDAVTVAAYSSAHEKLLYIAQAAAGSIQKVFTATITKDAAGYGDFIEIQIHPGSHEIFVVHIANGDRYFRHTRGFAPAGAACSAKNDISHFSATQCLGRLFPENPTNSVRYIGFSTPVWADNGRDSGLEIQRCSIGKRLETNRL